MPPFARQTLSRRNFPQRSRRRRGGGGSPATSSTVALDVFRARPSPLALGHMIACRHCRQPHSRGFFGRNFCYKNGGVQLKSISLSPLSALNRATPTQRRASPSPLLDSLAVCPSVGGCVDFPLISGEVEIRRRRQITFTSSDSSSS